MRFFHDLSITSGVLKLSRPRREFGFETNTADFEYMVTSFPQGHIHKAIDSWEQNHRKMSHLLRWTAA